MSVAERTSPVSDESRTERVLLVEDDESLADLLVEELEDAGHAVRAAQTAEAALAVLGEERIDLIVTDLRLPEASGRDLLERVQEGHLPPAVIMITAFGTVPQAVEALRAGADDFLTKPLDLDHFEVAVRRALEHRRLRRRVEEYDRILGRDHFHGLIGSSRPMTELFETVRRVAPGSGPVLITGESGTGKELVARALHAESDRSDGPFLAVNCAGVPADLLESEFFGHEKGAFTGAHERKDGLFVEADGGTLLLDEVGEMPIDLQAKLLRVLQEGQVRPVGSASERSVDVRVLASTNRDLERAVGEGEFREDLFYRLETFHLHVPPLRERGDDVDLLVAHFLKRFGEGQEPSVTELSPEALDRLRFYGFPGNVRELENAIQRAATFCEGSTVQVEHLPPRIRRHTGSEALSTGDVARADLLADGELPALEELERRYIELVLDRVDGNKRRAARILGISRRTLYRRLDRDEESDSPE